jgi:hypothetical protein
MMPKWMALSVDDARLLLLATASNRNGAKKYERKEKESGMSNARKIGTNRANIETSMGPETVEGKA